jgi:thiol-disulfide isomerase/thioredoxin
MIGVQQIINRSMLYRHLALLITTLTLVACGASSSAPSAGPAVAHTIASDSKIIGDMGQTGIPEIGTPAPNFEYTTADGITHRLSDLRGKVVLLNFWATWCGPCRSEMPDLQKVLGETGDSIAVLGVNKLEEATLIAPFADELHISFPLIANPSGDIASRYAAQNLPTSYFINSDGTIGLRKIGVMNYTFIKAHLAQLK